MSSTRSRLRLAASASARSKLLKHGPCLLGARTVSLGREQLERASCLGDRLVHAPDLREDARKVQPRVRLVGGAVGRQGMIKGASCPPLGGLAVPTGERHLGSHPVGLDQGGYVIRAPQLLGELDRRSGRIEVSQPPVGLRDERLRGRSQAALAEPRREWRRCAEAARARRPRRPGTIQARPDAARWSPLPCGCPMTKNDRPRVASATGPRPLVRRAWRPRRAPCRCWPRGPGRAAHARSRRVALRSCARPGCSTAASPHRRPERVAAKLRPWHCVHARPRVAAPPRPVSCGPSASGLVGQHVRARKSALVASRAKRSRNPGSWDSIACVVPGGWT